METREDLIILLPEQIQRLFAPTTPVPQRLMAAKGLLPTTPENLVLALLLLQSDKEPTVAAAAAGTLSKMPPNIMVSAIKHEKTPRIVLSAIAPLAQVSKEIAEALLLNPKTGDDIFLTIAAIGDESICEIIALNQARILNNPAIAKALAQNPKALKSSIDRLFDFLVRSGVTLEDSPEYEAALERLSPAEQVEMANKVDLPPEVLSLLESPEVPTTPSIVATPAAASSTSPVSVNGPSVAPASAVTAGPTNMASQAAGATPIAATGTAPAQAEAAEGDQKRIPMMKLISTLNTAQKVALATKGNKEARAILIKDANKMVATAVIKSPGITEQEIAAAAASRSVNEDVIRIICKSAAMMRGYSVKVALVNNPRTPLPLALKLLTQLRKNDVKMVSKSKGLPSALVNLAKKLATS